MKKLFIRIIPLLTLIINCSNLNAAEKINGIYYEIIGNVAIVVNAPAGSMSYSDDIVIPESISIYGQDYKVVAIGDYTFRNCNIKSISLPSTLLSIGKDAFVSCFDLHEINIPESVNELGESVFSASGLHSIKLHKSITNIPKKFCNSCVDLTQIEIPSTVTNIEERAFCDCQSISTIRCLNPTPPTLGNLVFGRFNFKGCDKEKCILYVPIGSKELYQNAQGWNEFKNIVETEFSGIEDVSIDYSNPIYIYDINGNMIGGSIDNLSSGIYIIRQGAKARKIIVK